MKTRAVRLYGKEDLRLEEFELPPIKEDEILAKVLCDSLCMSSYKAVHQGIDHKRIPPDVSSNPVIIGHEFAGELVQVGKKWAGLFQPGQKFSIQPAINYEQGPVGVLGAPGYSYSFCGGDATYVIIPREVMMQNCLLPYTGRGYYPASLAEPLSCVIGAMHANYHTKPGSYRHEMEIVRNGTLALLAAAGPMGLAAINYVIHREDLRPGLLVVTDIDRTRLERAEKLFPPSLAAAKGITLHYLNTAKTGDPVESLRSLTGGNGFNDVFVFAPVPSLIEQADKLLAQDGCLNFFAGPSDANFRAYFNFYNVHYEATHITGTSGGNYDDMKEALEYLSRGLDPAGLVTHIGGIDAVIDTTFHINMPLTAIDDFKEKGKDIPLFRVLHAICTNNKGLWSVEAEEFLLRNPELAGEKN
jgi:threonine dehydrogenase-like Zn-dependent dehydrogenase